MLFLFAAARGWEANLTRNLSSEIHIALLQIRADLGIDPWSVLVSSRSSPKSPRARKPSTNFIWRKFSWNVSKFEIPQEIWNTLFKNNAHSPFVGMNGEGAVLLYGDVIGCAPLRSLLKHLQMWETQKTRMTAPIIDQQGNRAPSSKLGQRSFAVDTSILNKMQVTSSRPLFLKQS